MALTLKKKQLSRRRRIWYGKLIRFAVKSAGALKIAAVIVDLLIINSSYVAAFYLRFLGSPPERNFTVFFQAAPFITLTALVYIDWCGMLKFYRRSRRAIFSAVTRVAFMQALTTISIAYVIVGDLSFPRSILLLMAPAFQVATLTAWNWLVLGIRVALKDTPKATLIGGEKAVAAFMDGLSRAPKSDRMSLDVRRTCAPDDSEEIRRALRATDEAIICSDVPWSAKTEIFLACQDMRKAVCFVPEPLDFSLSDSSVIHVGEMPLCVAGSLSLTSEQRFFKRAFDVVVTLLSAPVMLPAMALAALAVRLSSPGPIFYSQDRVTFGGRVYRIYKFRSMRADAESDAIGPRLSYEGDDRVTGAGRFLRKYKIDELPQLFNVLRGDMSLVGPRSERPFFVERFNEGIEGYRLRSHVKAGLTGFAQVYGEYDTSPEIKLKNDVLYIKQYSLVLDVKIILMTLRVIFKKK